MVKGYAPLAAHNKPHVAQGTCAETQRQASPCCEAGGRAVRRSQIAQGSSFTLELTKCTQILSNFRYNNSSWLELFLNLCR
jgi:hypothetical protein